jgi:hypothetical protein
MPRIELGGDVRVPGGDATTISRAAGSGDGVAASRGSTAGSRRQLRRIVPEDDKTTPFFAWVFQNLFHTLANWTRCNRPKT